MKVNAWAFALIGLANASAVMPRDAPSDYQPAKDYSSKSPPPKYYPSKPPHQKYPVKSYPPKSYPSKPYPANNYPNNDYDNYGPNDHNGKSGSGYAPDKSDYYPSKSSKDSGYTYQSKNGRKKSWKPKSQNPQFFNLRVDDQCVADALGVPEDPVNCPFNNYAIRLEGGNFIATPYDRFYDPKLASFFVDDDTSLYTVSREPLQVYIDSITGALKYSKIGWLPPNAIARNFFHTGNNPLGLLDPSSSYLSWPSTVGSSFFGPPWMLCPIGGTLQYQVFINGENFGVGGSAGILKEGCVTEDLASVNANPWA